VGLALKPIDEEDLDTSDAAATEVPLALVMPAQPGRISADVSNVEASKRVTARGMERTGRWVEM
jgi:hypothetical protein